MDMIDYINIDHATVDPR